MEKKLRIGIIGTGGIAHAHMRAYQLLDDVVVVAGADIVPGKAREFFDEFDMPDAPTTRHTRNAPSPRWRPDFLSFWKSPCASPWIRPPRSSAPKRKAASSFR